MLDLPPNNLEDRSLDTCRLRSSLLLLESSSDGVPRATRSNVRKGRNNQRMTTTRKSSLLIFLATLICGFIHTTAEESPDDSPSEASGETAVDETAVVEKVDVPADGAGEASEEAVVGAIIPLEPIAPLSDQDKDVVLPFVELDPAMPNDPYWTPELVAAELPPLDEIPLDESPLEEEIAEDEETQSSPLLYNPVFRAPGSAPGNAAYTFDGRPTGFNNAPVFLPPPDSGGKLLKGFNFSTNLTGTYNSNVTQATGRAGDPVDGDFIIGIGGTVSYLSTARLWTFGGNYSGSYDQYLENEDFSGFNQSAGLVANYNGAKLSASLNTGFSLGRGGNRNFAASSFVEQISINNNLSARYAYSAKTSITADAGYSFTTASGGNFSDTNSFNLGLAALWKYSPLTEFGPGIRYTANSGGGNNDRTSLGPTLNLNYKLSTKVSLNSRVGLDFTSFSDGGSSDPTTSALIGLNYNASSLWGMNLSLYRDAQADASVANTFTEVTSLRIGYNRKIRRATFDLGVGYEVSTSENPSNVPGGSRPDRDYFTFDTSLGMAIFRNTTQASIFYRYSDQSGGAGDSFDSSQVGFSLSRGF